MFSLTRHKVTATRAKTQQLGCLYKKSSPKTALIEIILKSTVIISSLLFVRLLRRFL